MLLLEVAPSPRLKEMSTHRLKPGVPGGGWLGVTMVDGLSCGDVDWGLLRAHPVHARSRDAGTACCRQSSKRCHSL